MVRFCRKLDEPRETFQQGQIDASTMPNFAKYYNYAETGQFNWFTDPIGRRFWCKTCRDGSAATLTDAELAVINGAANAPARAVLPYRTFPFTSGYGYIVPGNPYTFAGFDPETNVDLDQDGTLDCLQSFSGYNSVFGAASFGALGGCWNVTENGQYRPIQDGLVSGNFEGFGGDSYNTIQQPNGYLILPNEKVALTLSVITTLMKIHVFSVNLGMWFRKLRMNPCQAHTGIFYLVHQTTLIYPNLFNLTLTNTVV